MTKRQEEYIFDRILNPLKTKRNQVIKRHTVVGVVLSDKEKLDLIYSPKSVPLLPKEVVQSHYSRYLLTSFDFSKYESSTIVDEKAIKKELRPFEDRAVKMRDEIMLGDSAQAMEMIASWTEELIK